MVSAASQHLATRRAAALFDFSFMSLTEVDGPAATEFVADIQTRSIATLDAGSIVYTLLLDQHANVLIDATVWKHARDRWWLFTGRRTDTAAIDACANGFDVGIRDRAPEFAVLALQGPASGRALAQIADARVVRALAYFRFAKARVAGVASIVARLGYSGELGYEIVVPATDAIRIRNALRALGVADAGFEAADSLRIESGYVLFDREITGRENPVELRLERLVDLDGRHFRGRRALVTLRRSEPRRRLVGLEIVDRVASSSLPAAHATSECHSPIFRRRIALGFAAPSVCNGSLVRLTDGRLARTARLPFYDPLRRLPRGVPL